MPRTKFTVDPNSRRMVSREYESMEFNHSRDSPKNQQKNSMRSTVDYQGKFGSSPVSPLTLTLNPNPNPKY